MIARIEKRSLRLDAHRTSVALEPCFWTALEKIARAERLSLSRLIVSVDRMRPSDVPLASALRQHAMLARENGRVM